MTWWSSDAAERDREGPRDWSWTSLPGERAGVEPSPAEEAEAAAERGYDEGFRDGLAEGEARAAAELMSAVRAAHEAATRVQEAQDELAMELRDDVLVLALAVARQIVDRELAGDAETFADMVREALNTYPMDQKVKIRVHPADLSRISAAADGEVIPIAGGRDVQWAADAAVAEGGCVLEGPDRVLDGRVDHTLERVYRRLRRG